MDSDLLGQLKSASAKARREAASQLGDYFETGRLKDTLARQIIETLVTAAASERRRSVLDEILNSLLLAAGNAQITQASLDPLLPVLGRLGSGLLSTVIAILGATHNPRYRDVVAQYASHRNKDVRQASADAIFEIDHAQ